MPHRSDTSDTYTSSGEYLLAGGISWGGLLIVLIALKLLEESI